MPREDRMFGSVVDPSTGMKNRQGVSVLATTLIEAAVVALLIAVPLVATDALPVPLHAMDAFVIAEAPPPPPPPPPGPATPERSQPAAPASTPVVSLEPAPVPIEALPFIAPEPPTDISFESRGSGGGGGGVPGGIGDVPGGAIGAPPPPVVRPKPEPPKGPVRVGGSVSPPRKTKHVAPVYPAIAIASRVDGKVILEATIDEAGRVVNVRVLEGRPLLDNAALEAVRQWEFTPTLLNGVPTPVIMNVTVNFQLH